MEDCTTAILELQVPFRLIFLADETSSQYTADELAQAIRFAHLGRATLSPEAAQVLVEAASQPPTPGHDLTEREWAVPALMVDGLNNTQIARRLGVSPSTGKSHVGNILTKLGVTSRTEAAALAVRHHLIT